MIDRPRSAPVSEFQQSDTHVLLVQLDQRVAHLARTIEIAANQTTHRVTVKDFDMPFGSMVGFMVKWAIAAIPALIILALVGFFASAFLTAFLMAM